MSTRRSEVLHRLMGRFWVREPPIKKEAFDTPSDENNYRALENEESVGIDTLKSMGSPQSDQVVALRRCSSNCQKSTRSAEPAKQEENQALDSENEVPFKLTRRHIICFSVLLLALAATALDYSATGNIMATIATDLNGSTAQTEWIGNGYSLAACVFQLPISVLSDIFGRLAMFIASLILFFVGSLICGTAQTMEAVVAGRVIQGAGGGGLLVLPEVVLSDTVPLRYRSVYYGLFGITWCIFSGIAPLVAGALAEYASWRWFFYMNLFITGVAGVASPYAIRLKQRDQHWLEKLKDIDYGGGILTIASATSLLLALSWGGSSASRPWSSYSVIVPLVLGAVGLIATGFYEYWMKPKIPMFDIRVFGNVSASICYIHNILQGVVNVAALYYLPTFFQGGKGYGQLISGACVLPLNIVGPPVTLIFSYIIEATGHYHFINIIMWGLATAGVGLLVLYDTHRSLVTLIFLQIPASIGISCLYATLSITANATNPPYLITESTAMMSFFRSIGDALGTSIGGAVVASQLNSRLATLSSKGLNIPDHVSVLSIVSFIKTIDNPEVKEAMLKALSETIQTLFIVLTCFCAVGFVITFFQKEYTLNTEHEAKQGIKND